MISRVSIPSKSEIEAMIPDYDFLEQLSFVDSVYSTKNPSPIVSDAILQDKVKTISDNLAL
jgi:hypothetical protein